MTTVDRAGHTAADIAFDRVRLVPSLSPLDFLRHQPFRAADWDAVLCLLLQRPDISPSDAAAASTMIVLLGSTVWHDDQHMTALFYAVKNGHDRLAALLIKYCKHRGNDHRDSEGRTPLHEAAAQGRTWIALQLISSRICNVYGLDFYDSNGMSPLHLAAANGHLETVEALVFNGALLDGRGGTESPLHLAASEGRLSVVEHLMRYPDCDVNGRDGNDMTALHCAAEIGHDTVIETLLSMEAVDVNTLDRRRITPLMSAVKSCKPSSIALLTRHAGCNARLVDPHGRTALHYAAQSGQTATLEALLLPGISDINARDVEGATPLHLAIEKGHASSISILVNHIDCDINIKNTYGRTPLHMAAARGLVPTLMTMLELERRLDIRALDRSGLTALHVASSEKDTDLFISAMLKNTDFDVNARTGTGKTALHLAASAGIVKAVRTLLQNGADVESCDYHGIKPLRCAAECTRVEAAPTISLLIKAGARLSALDKHGRTALHAAAWVGAQENVVVLLRHNIDVFARTENGRSAEEFARDSGFPEVADLIRQRMDSTCDKLSSMDEDEEMTKVPGLTEQGAEEAIHVSDGQGEDDFSTSRAGR